MGNISFRKISNHFTGNRRTSGLGENKIVIPIGFPDGPVLADPCLGLYAVIMFVYLKDYCFNRPNREYAMSALVCDICHVFNVFWGLCGLGEGHASQAYQYL